MVCMVRMICGEEGRDQPFRVVFLQKIQVGVPLVAYDLSAGEAAHRDDHCLSVWGVQQGHGEEREGGSDDPLGRG